MWDVQVFKSSKLPRLHDAQNVLKNTGNSVALFLGNYTATVSTVPFDGVMGLYSNDCGFEIAEQQMASHTIQRLSVQGFVRCWLELSKRMFEC